MQFLLSQCNVAFKSSDGAQYRAGRADLTIYTREVKTAYKRKREELFNDKDGRILPM